MVDETHTPKKNLTFEFRNVRYFRYFLFFTGASSPQEACEAADFDCPSYSDQIGLEAIRSLHRQLDDDDNGDIDLSESDDV